MKTSKFSSADALKMSVSLALAAGMTTAIPSAFAQDDEAAATEGRIEVTGSRIKRADIEGALPVTVIDREAIELSGHVSVQELIRNTSFNSFGSFRPVSGSSAQGLATVSLRGLGSTRTLILIDGRRAPVAPSTGAQQDLNTIPLAAVERIEILSDGASAIYGTDAIGGVINIITRKDFTGAQLMAGMGRPKNVGGDTDEGSFLIGAASDRGRVMGGASYSNRDIIWQRDHHWTPQGASTFSNNFREAATGLPFVADPVNGSVVPGGCSAAGFSITGTGASQRCAYDFTSSAAYEAANKNNSLFLRGDYRINDDWSVYFNGSVTRNNTFGRYAPSLAFAFVPASSPNNPYGRDLYVQHRFAALGTRDDFVEANVYDMNVGFMGRVGMVDLDIGARQSKFRSFDLGKNYVVIPLANAAIASGAYNILDPFGNPESVLNSIKATNSRDQVSWVDEMYAIGSFDLPFEMDGGVASAAAGFEYRDEGFNDEYDSLRAAGAIGGSSGGSSGLGRNVTAVFFETLFPVTEDLEIGFAGRHDSYSDYGSDFSPKLSARWQPLDAWTFRASWGQGFAAPALSSLSAAPAQSADPTTDPATCLALGLTVSGGQCFNAQGQSVSPQVPVWVIENPNLVSENSTQFSIGAVWDQLDWVNVSLDYYDIEIENSLTGVTLTTMINCLAPTPTEPCPAGVGVLDETIYSASFNGDNSIGLGIARDPATGAIVFAQRGPVNRGTIETSGLDLNVRTNFAFGGWGELRSDLQFSYVNDLRINGGSNLVGFSSSSGSTPQFRAVLANQWEYGDYQLGWNVNVIDGYLNVSQTRTQPTWVTHDVQLNYFTPWNGRMTFGVTNLGHKDPPIDGSLLRTYDTALYNAYGRVPYLRYTQTF